MKLTQKIENLWGRKKKKRKDEDSEESSSFYGSGGSDGVSGSSFYGVEENDGSGSQDSMYDSDSDLGGGGSFFDDDSLDSQNKSDMSKWLVYAVVAIEIILVVYTLLVLTETIGFF